MWRLPRDFHLLRFNCQARERASAVTVNFSCCLHNDVATNAGISCEWAAKKIFVVYQEEIVTCCLQVLSKLTFAPNDWKIFQLDCSSIVIKG